MKLLSRVVAPAVILGAISFGTAAAEDPASAWEVRPVMVGTMVPDISFLNEQGESFSLRERAKEKPLILVVYRGLW